MRKFFAPLILSLFFFLPFKVKASTYNVNINPNYYSIFKDTGFKDFYDTVSSKSSYYIIYGSSNYRYYTSSSNSNYSCSYDSTFKFQCKSSFSGNVYWHTFTFPPFKETGDSNSSYFVRHLYSNNYIIASNMPLSIPKDVFVFSDGTYSYTCDTSIGCTSLPTLLDFYKMFYEDPTIDPIPPEPEDNTPLLTTFYSVVIEKIGYICTFFSSNYLYLSVFVIFLFYISILLLRRLFK